MVVVGIFHHFIKIYSITIVSTYRWIQKAIKLANKEFWFIFRNLGQRKKCVTNYEFSNSGTWASKFMSSENSNQLHLWMKIPDDNFGRGRTELFRMGKSTGFEWRVFMIGRPQLMMVALSTAWMCVCLEFGWPIFLLLSLVCLSVVWSTSNIDWRIKWFKLRTLYFWGLGMFLIEFDPSIGLFWSWDEIHWSSIENYEV